MPDPPAREGPDLQALEAPSPRDDPASSASVAEDVTRVIAQRTSRHPASRHPEGIGPWGRSGLPDAACGPAGAGAGDARRSGGSRTRPPEEAIANAGAVGRTRRGGEDRAAAAAPLPVTGTPRERSIVPLALPVPADRARVGDAPRWAEIDASGPREGTSSRCQA